MERVPLIRLLVACFVLSVVGNALLGIWALLVGDFGETQGRILLSSFLVSAAMLSVLVNIPAVRRRALWPAPVVGGAAAAAGFALFLVLVWAEPDAETWYRSAAEGLVVGAGATLASSLAMVPTAHGLRWLQRVKDLLIAVLVVTLMVLIWDDPGTDWFARLIGVESVLVAAVTLLLPVVSRFGADDTGVDGEWATAVAFCPSCGAELGDSEPATTAAGERGIVTCGRCGLAFTVAVRGGGQDDGRDGGDGEPVMASPPSPAPGAQNEPR